MLCAPAIFTTSSVMFSRISVVAFACLAVSACGGASVSVPEPVRGIWAADCASPFVSFNQDSVHIYPDNASYAISQVTFDGNNLVVKYTTPAGPVTETYMKSGETLRLDHGTYAGVDTTWHKSPMNRCPAS